MIFIVSVSIRFEEKFSILHNFWWNEECHSGNVVIILVRICVTGHFSFHALGKCCINLYVH